MGMTSSSNDRGGVVVAVDGSESSRAALRWACGLGVPLRVVQTWEFPSTIPLPWSRLSSHTAEELDEEVRSDLADFVASSVPDQAQVTTEVLRGPAAAALLAHASETGPALLVLGTRGRGGFAGLRLGSVSHHCLEHASCPVAVVPGPERATIEPGLSTIAVGIDGSESAGRALDLAVALAGDTGATVVAIHVFDTERPHLPSDVMSRVRTADEERFAAQRDLANSRAEISRSMIVDGDPRRMLLDTASREGADLLVIGAVGVGTLRKELGPVASYAASHSTVPLAVVR
jgi:nucleotide-binding universal stress UspA family protein